MWENRYLCFGLLVPSALDFKARVDPLLVCFITCVQWIPQIQLWCDTCWSLGGRHGSVTRLNHILEPKMQCVWHSDCVLWLFEPLKGLLWVFLVSLPTPPPARLFTRTIILGFVRRVFMRLHFLLSKWFHLKDCLHRSKELHINYFKNEWHSRPRQCLHIFIFHIDVFTCYITL